jgi:hypothetical protein
MKIKVVFLVLCILLLLYIIFYPSDISYEKKASLCKKIESAKSIELCLITTEELPTKAHKILARLTLSREGRSSMENIFRRTHFFQSWYGFTVFGYEASHMILIHNSDGTADSVIISFRCLKIRIDDGDIYSLPPAWSFSLKDLFLQAGMPLRPELFENLGKS